MLRKLSLLVKQYGFRTVSTDEKAIAFTSPVAFVRVWREPQSYEIGLDLGLSADADEKFYSSDLIGLYEPALQRRFQAADEEGTIFAVKRLAQVLREHGDELLRGNSFAYKRLRDEQVRSSNAFLHGHELQDVRTAADEACPAGDYSRVPQLLSSFERELTAAAKEKLRYARERAE